MCSTFRFPVRGFWQKEKLEERVKDKHYQLTSTTNSRIKGNVDKLLSHFKSIDLSFESCEHMYNIPSDAVLLESITSDIANQQSTGKKMYEPFKSERIYGEKSIWDAMKKYKLQIFKSSGVMFKTKIEEKLIEFTEDKQLLQCVLTISQKCREINLPKLVGKNEFSNIPCSMFSIDGKILPRTMKSQILHTTEKSVAEASTSKRSLIDNTDEKPLNAVIIHVMTLLNKIQITPQIKTCSEIKMTLKNHLVQETSKFDHIELVFDRYLNCSLKEQCREKRTSGRQIKHIIRDSTLLEGITLKDFLSHIEIKSDLTTYLTEYCVKELEKRDKKFVVVYQTSCVTNIEKYPPDLEYNHEEADILIMLQAKNVTDIHPNCEIDILSSDTDVFLLAIHFYLKFSPKLVIRMGNAPDIFDVDIGKVCNSLSAKNTEAILGWHSFTGCDQTARFYGKLKNNFYKTFKSESAEVYLNHYAISEPIRQNGHKLLYKVYISLSLIHILKPVM